MSISAINSLPVSALDRDSTRKLNATLFDILLISKGTKYWTYIILNASKNSGESRVYAASIPEKNGTVPTLLEL